MPRNWTDEEKYNLIKCINDGMSFRYIGKELDRSETAVMSKFNEIINRTIKKGYYELTLMIGRNLHDKPIYDKIRIMRNKPFTIPSLHEDPMDVEEDFNDPGPSSQQQHRGKKRTRVEV